MRLWALLFTAILLASPAGAQQTPASSSQDGINRTTGARTLRRRRCRCRSTKIREALSNDAGACRLRSIDERPIFSIQIQERQTNRGAARHAQLQGRVRFRRAASTWPSRTGSCSPASINPLRQQLGAFNQSELLTILIENLAGKYLAGRRSIGDLEVGAGEREAAAQDEVRAAVAQYCSAQPNARRRHSDLRVLRSPMSATTLALARRDGARRVRPRLGAQSAGA